MAASASVFPAGAAGFSGSRSLPPSWAPVVCCLVSSLPLAVPVLVGDAAGADALVRSACAAAGRPARIFAVSGVRSPGALVARSVALVSALAACSGAFLVALAAGPCPAGIVPACGWRSGLPPSGTWSSAALAAGRGAAVVVAWCGAGAPVLPAWPDGVWLPLASLPWAPSVPAPCALFAWSPAAAEQQLGLF